jgi:hypothetical protein
MYVVTYAVKVRPDQRRPFFVCWRTIAEAKRDHCGSLGSRLLAEPDGTYVVYEEWPDRAAYEACALPDNYLDLTTDLHGRCETWDKTAELDLVDVVTAG